MLIGAVDSSSWLLFPHFLSSRCKRGTRCRLSQPSSLRTRRKSPGMIRENWSPTSRRWPVISSLRCRATINLLKSFDFRMDAGKLGAGNQEETIYGR
jgi:hypothetical protein